LGRLLDIIRFIREPKEDIDYIRVSFGKYKQLQGIPAREGHNRLDIEIEKDDEMFSDCLELCKLIESKYKQKSKNDRYKRYLELKSEFEE